MKKYWLTPPELYDELNKEFNFDYDPCPYPKPDNYDGLEADWGQSNYVNPPFKGSSFAKWARKAVMENKKGKLVFMVLPIQTWIYELLSYGFEFRPMGRVKWCNVEYINDRSAAQYPIAGIILR
jgi:hypothetical protein